LTSGYNKIFDTKTSLPIDGASGEWVFIYDVTPVNGGGAPRETQVVHIDNTFGGLAFHPSGDRFYASGGSDDSVHEIVRGADGKFKEKLAQMRLGHLDKDGFGGLGLHVGPYAAGLALSASGDRLVVANHENDSITLIDTKGWIRGSEISIAGPTSGGTFPVGVVVIGEDRAFVTSQRDREVVEVDLGKKAVSRRIKVGGMPTKIIANRAGTRLFVANANTDSVSVIDVAEGTVLSEIATTAPDAAWRSLGTLRGSNPNAVALSPDERTLYVTNGGNNTLAIIPLSAADRGDASREEGAKAPTAGGTANGASPDVSLVSGLVPTGLYPNAVTVSADGKWLYVSNGKSTTGPNADGPWSHPDRSRQRPYTVVPGNQFSLQLVRGGLLALPAPSDDAIVSKLTIQSLLNNRFAEDGLAVPPIFATLRGKVKHVIFVVGENRTYDQIFGDLAGADGDPKMTLWGDAITPNHHALARTFVTLDRFFDSGGVSGDGWQWTMAGRATDVAEKEVPLEYSDRGHHPYDWEGTNRNINMGLPTLAQRKEFNPLTPDYLPGMNDVAAIDGPDQGGRGFLWDVAMAAGLTVRNYGAYCDEFRYGISDKDPNEAFAKVPMLDMPDKTQTRVAFPTKASLQDVTDPYFRGFDMKFADVWREKEWEREFDAYVAKGEIPALEIVRLPHDHLGAFGRAADGVDTPDTQMADNDYALGAIVEKVSKTPFWNDTVIIKIEDDAQNGADHVDAHRSIALFAGGYVKRGGAVVSSAYATPSVLRTIELLLGLPALGQHDAVARPIEEAFSEKVDATPFTAIVPPVLRSTQLPLPAPAMGDGGVAACARPRGDRTFWELATQGFDFDHTDALPVDRFNRILWCGLVDDRGCASEPQEVAAAPDHDDDDGDGDD
jgi:YVTN family beta-propeller protein